MLFGSRRLLAVVRGGFQVEPKWDSRALEVAEVPGAGRGWLARREASAAVMEDLLWLLSYRPYSVNATYKSTNQNYS